MTSVNLERVRAHSIVLGTSSKYRHALFRQHFPSLPFTALSAAIDERAISAGYTDRSTVAPGILTLALAHAKASALLPKLGPNTLLLTSDQVVSFDGRIREKPSSAEECRMYLRSYATQPVVTITAVVVTSSTGRRYEGVDIAKQFIRPISEEVIDKLIEKGDVLHCAGGITVEDELLAPFLAEREGTLDSIMGLPVDLVRQLLANAAG